MQSSAISIVQCSHDLHSSGDGEISLANALFHYRNLVLHISGPSLVTRLSRFHSIRTKKSKRQMTKKMGNTLKAGEPGISWSRA